MKRMACVSIRLMVAASLCCFLLLSYCATQSSAFDCTLHCKKYMISVGNCRCKGELFRKRGQNSEGSDGGRDFLLRELLKDYFLQNEENEDK